MFYLLKGISSSKSIGGSGWAVGFLRVNFVESGEMLKPHKTVVEAHSLRFVVGHSRRSVHDHRGN